MLSFGTMADPAPLLPAYLILGTDRPKVRRAVARLRQRVIDEAGSDLNVVVLDAEHDKVEVLIDAAASPGLTFGTRLLLILNGHKWNAKARQQIVAYLQDPMPDTCVALEAESLAASDALFKAVTKLGGVLHFDLPEEVRDGGVGQGARQGAPAAHDDDRGAATCWTAAATTPAAPRRWSARSRSSPCTAAGASRPRPTWTRSAPPTTTP